MEGGTTDSAPEEKSPAHVRSMVRVEAHRKKKEFGEAFSCMRRASRWMRSSTR